MTSSFTSNLQYRCRCDYEWTGKEQKKGPKNPKDERCKNWTEHLNCETSVLLQMGSLRCWRILTSSEQFLEDKLLGRELTTRCHLWWVLRDDSVLHVPLLCLQDQHSEWCQHMIPDYPVQPPRILLHASPRFCPSSIWVFKRIVYLARGRQRRVSCPMQSMTGAFPTSHASQVLWIRK